MKSFKQFFCESIPSDDKDVLSETQNNYKYIGAYKRITKNSVIATPRAFMQSITDPSKAILIYQSGEVLRNLSEDIIRDILNLFEKGKLQQKYGDEAGTTLHNL